MNSLPWIGKIIGCFSAEPLIETRGYRNTMYVAAAVQIVAVISKFICSLSAPSGAITDTRGSLCS